MYVSCNFLLQCDTNAAYVSMYLLCNHATKLNMPLFAWKIMEEENLRKMEERNMTTVVVMQNRRGCYRECHTVLGHNSRVLPLGSLCPFSSTGL